MSVAAVVSIKESSRKRRDSGLQSPGPEDIWKRPRTLPSIALDELSFEQRHIVVQAASILHVPFDELPSALDHIQKPNRASYSEFGGEDQNLTNTSLKFSPILDSIISPNEPGSLDTFSNNLVYADDNLESDLQAMDNIFNPDKARWGECFANLVPWSRESRQPDNGESLSRLIEYNTSQTSDGQPLFSRAMSYTDEVPVYDHSQRVAFNPNMYESQFACDPVFDPRWMSQYPVLQPTKGQEKSPKTQQPLPKAAMVYPEAESIVSINDWVQLLGPEQNVTRSAPVSASNQPEHKRRDSRQSHIPNKRRPFENPQDKAQTAQTRKDVACLRCRMQHLRCNPDPENPKGVCVTCKKVSNPKTCKSLQCFRWKINDIVLFQKGQYPGLEWTARWSDQLGDISRWVSVQTRTIALTEGYCSKPLDVDVAEFVPVNGDMLCRSWVHKGVKKSVKIPAYALFDLTKARHSYADYINDRGAEFFKGALNPKEKLLVGTYSKTFETANDPATDEEQRKLIKMVLRLWVATRMNSTSTFIAGQDTLGMPADILDETYPTPGRIPIPPVMGSQIGFIVQDVQVALRARILEQLQKLILANKWSNWFTIYICTFVLLHNCAMVTKHDAAYAIKHGLKNRFARPGTVREFHEGANNLLAHWHYCCKGLNAFNGEDVSLNELIRVTGMNTRQIKFITATRDYVKAKSFRFDEIRRQGIVEDNYFFISQLYESDWEPRSVG